MKFDNKAIRNTEICKKQASKQVIQTKEAQKQTTCTSSKILQIHKKQAQIRGKTARLATLVQGVILCTRDDRIVDFYYPILSSFVKMISVSDPNPVLVEIILSVSENYTKVYCDEQHTLLCCVYFAS